LPIPWYVRTWQASGNPFFPQLFNLFGAYPAERWDAITQQSLNHFLAKFGRPRTLENLLTLPWDMTVGAARYGGTLGPMFLVLLPAMAVLRPTPRMTLWFVSFVILYLVLWASSISSFQMRYVLPITPFLAVLAAEVCSRLVIVIRNGRVPLGRWMFYGGLTLLFTLNLPPFIPLQDPDGWLTHVMRRLPIDVVAGREFQEDYLNRSVPSYAAWRFINTSLPKNVRVLAFCNGDHFYSERERIWSDSTVIRHVVWRGTIGQEQQSLQALSKFGISHILFDKTQLDTLEPGTIGIAQPSVVRRWYDKKYEDRYFVLYRIRWEEMKKG
jgi:hypothetical protein